MIVFLLVLLLAAYVVLLNIYLYGWRKEVNYKQEEATLTPFVSVIVPARNEKDNIASCIKSLLSQNYKGEYEVVVVDDHSDDGTSDVLKERFGDSLHLRVIRQARGNSGKKAALQTGIGASQGEIIATVDADCIVGDSWLHTCMGEFEHNVQIATGPVLIRKASNALEAYQALDLLSLSMVTGGGLNMGLHVLGNGANLLFRREAFDRVGGYRSGAQFASGDDLFLLQNIANEFGNEAVAYVGSPEAVVWTDPETDLQSLNEQRLRWASKNSDLPDQAIQFIWGFIWVINFVTLLLIPLVLIGSISLTLALAFILIKGAQEYIALRVVAEHYSLSVTMDRFPLSFLMNIAYISAIGIKSLITKEYTWKGRTVR